MAASALADSVDVAHIAAGLLAEPEGLAAKTIHRLGVTDEQVYGVLGVGPVTGSYDSDPVALRELEFSDASKAAFRGTLKSALRLGHNYIGTEHLLLGVLSLENDTTERMTGLGLSGGLVDQALAIELASFRLDRERGTA
jgi:ATP-dependent Clp protease ATP-binding subunit ClpA